MSTFWSIWVSVIVLGTVFGCWWLLWATRKSQTTDTETDRTMGHSFDGIEEYDNPLPKWWFYLFVATCIFALGYLALYRAWATSRVCWDGHPPTSGKRKWQLPKRNMAKSMPSSATLPFLNWRRTMTMKIGQRLFANNCSVCHGTAARGQVGFPPNLTDEDWLWGGGQPDQILHSIAQGRNGNMPAKGVMPNMTNEQVDQVVNYVLSFSGREEDAEAAKAGARCSLRPALPATVRKAKVWKPWVRPT